MSIDRSTDVYFGVWNHKCLRINRWHYFLSFLGLGTQISKRKQYIFGFVIKNDWPHNWCHPISILADKICHFSLEYSKSPIWSDHFKEITSSLLYCAYWVTTLPSFPFWNRTSSSKTCATSKKSFVGSFKSASQKRRFRKRKCLPFVRELGQKWWEFNG